MYAVTGSEIALVVYALIVVRWFYVINKYHADVLEYDTSYDEHKNHPIFKFMLFGRALVLASIAPVMGFFKPSLFDQFIDGVKVSRARIATGLIVSR